MLYFSVSILNINDMNIIYRRNKTLFKNTIVGCVFIGFLKSQY